MANAYYNVGLATPISDIKTALQTQYGAGNVTVHYETTAYLIFSCAAIAEKVIKIYWYNSATLRIISYGDAWTSGSTITNEVVFGGYSAGTASEFHLVLGDSFFLLTWLASSVISGIAIIAKMTNDKYICVGLMGNSTYAASSTGRDTTDSVNITPVTLSKGFVNSSGKLYKSQLIFVKSNGFTEEEGDGDIAGITGLYSASYFTGSASTLVKAVNYLMSPCLMYMSDGAVYLRTCLFVEW